MPNVTVEAYTGNHVDRRGVRAPRSLIQPRYCDDADGDSFNVLEANTNGPVADGPNRLRHMVRSARVCRGPL